MTLSTLSRRSLLAAATFASVGGSASAATDGEITVFAASSLTDAMQALGDAYRRQTRVRVRFSFASSAAVARQLEAGAPADVFVSADEEWMDYVQQRNLITPASRVTLAGNRLALVAPASSKVRLTIGPGFPLARALGDGRLAMADPDTVPAGRYGKAALVGLGVWDQVSGRIARAENVRSALMFVARGEAPLGVVYRTDALVENKVRTVGLFPERSHPPILYPAALTRRASPAAGRFLQFARGPAGQALLRRFGFTKP